MKKTKITPENFPTKSKKNKRGEIINPTKEDIKRFNQMFTTTKVSNGPTKYQKFAMSKGMGKVLDSKVGKVGIKVGNVVLNRKNNLVNNIANLTYIEILWKIIIN